MLCSNEILKAKVYWGGVILYTIGYLVFCIGYFWAEFGNEGSASFFTLICDTIGSSFFTVGSFLLLLEATPPWGTESYKPDLTHLCSDILWGPPRTWHGLMLFQMGSCCFLAGSIVQMGVTDSYTATLLFQAHAHDGA